ncbi:MAG: NAD(P)H-hydrate dehydratase [Capsulimonadaceae bacterium]
MKLVTAAVMRDMDRRTIVDFHVPGIVLMENAALRVVEEIDRRHAPLDGRRVVVACGKGNNGGDGLAIARHLVVRLHASVEVWTLFDPDLSVDGDAGANLAMARAAGVPLRHYAGDAAVSDFVDALAHADLVVDAIFGTGFHGAAAGPVARMIDAIGGVSSRVVAVDIPSGVDADTGSVSGPAVRAALTVTFALPKIGLFCFPGADHTGELVVGDLSMPRVVGAEAPAAAWVTAVEDIQRWIPGRTNGRDTNKGHYGHAVVLAGSPGLLGAARLAALAAARTGAGLVTLAVPSGLHDLAMSGGSPVVMTRGLAQTARGTFAAGAVAEALDLCRKGSALAIGPGLGGTEDAETARFVYDIMTRSTLPVVVDADALNILSATTDGPAVVSGRSAATVLTPHPGEMGRLLARKTSDVQADRLGAVRDAVDRYGCTVLLKGARTLIASPDGRVHLNTTGHPGMGTGGAGDVLTGIVVALLGMGLEPHAAAAAGAYIHGLAGDLVAGRHGGTAGLIADDLVSAIPPALGRCQQGRLSPAAHEFIRG